MTSRLRVGVIGTGLIAQVMHLPHLLELDDRFDVRVICDASAEVAAHCARRFGVARVAPTWEALLDEDLDAVIVAVSGSHHPMAVAAAERGLHLFIEKPIAYSVAEALEMHAAAEASGVVLMVGYPKRYDPAVTRAARLVTELRDLPFVRVTTMEAAAHPYLSQYHLEKGGTDPSAAASWREDRDRRVHRAVGGVSPAIAALYEDVLLDTLVHEFNLLRGLLGEPTSVRHVSAGPATITVLLDFDSTTCSLAWISLPGVARYEMEFCFYDPAARVRLAFPSPYLRDTPAVLSSETGVPGGPMTTAVDVVSYISPFRLELEAWHAAITEGVAPLTTGLDGARDVALCQSVVACLTAGQPVDLPTALPRPGGQTKLRGSR
jgi:predicted dehydrogenase